MLPVIASVGVKERSVQMHPAALDKIVRDLKARPLIAIFGQILLNPPGTNRAPDFKLLFFAIYAGEFHPVAAIITDHFGVNTLIGEGVVAVKIAKDALGIRILGHGAMKSRMPRRVISFVAFPAIV
jgi:hypothetical protein